MNKPICYLFEKLNRQFAVSNENGDFYLINSQAYAALERLNQQIKEADTALDQEQIKEMATALGITDEVLSAFPMPENKKTRQPEIGITDITLNITSKCNLSCRYCWNDYGKYSNTSFRPDGDDNESAKDMPQDTISQEMSEEVAEKSLELLMKLRGDEKTVIVDFYGGEPLLNLKLIRFITDKGNKLARENGINIRYLLATNGTLLVPELADELINRGIQIAVSVDGPQEIQDKNRPFAGGQGSYEILSKNLAHMPDETKKRLVGRATVTPFFPKMVEIYNSLRDLGFERIELFESEDACHKLTPERLSAFFASDEQYLELIKEYERLAHHYIDEVKSGFLDYRKTFFNRFFKLMQRLYYQNQLAGGCPAGFGQIAVGIDGKIYPCTSFIGIEEYEIGDVNKGLDNEKYHRFLDNARKRDEYCSPCELYSLCRTTGSCLNMNQFFNQDIAKPYERGCDLFKEKMKLAIAALSILEEEIPGKLPELFGHDPAGARGNVYY